MSTISDISSSNIFDQLSKQNRTDSTQSAAGQDSEMFMKLMIAQLQSQDPTNPGDTDSFMQQISSMSMVEGITNLNSKIEEMTSSLMSSQAALQASSLVGRSVYVRADEVMTDGNGQIKGMMDLETSAPNVRISVFDQGGSLVDQIALGNLAPGTQDFTWQAPEGTGQTFRMVAESGDASSPELQSVYLAQHVNSVTLGQNGIGMTMNTDAGSYSVNDIKQIGS